MTITQDINALTRGMEHACNEILRALPPLPSKKKPAASPIGFCLADLPSKSLSWLWPQRIPSGKLTLLDGSPGYGTSLHITVNDQGILTLHWLGERDTAELSRLSIGPIHSSQRQAILHFLRGSPSAQSIKAIITATSYDYEAGRKMVLCMKQAGELVLVERSLYTTRGHPCLAPQETPSSSTTSRCPTCPKCPRPRHLPTHPRRTNRQSDREPDLNCPSLSRSPTRCSRCTPHTRCPTRPRRSQSPQQCPTHSRR